MHLHAAGRFSRRLHPATPTQQALNPGAQRQPYPQFGDAILAGLGLDEEAILDLKIKGVVA